MTDETSIRAMIQDWFGETLTCEEVARTYATIFAENERQMCKEFKRREEELESGED